MTWFATLGMDLAAESTDRSGLVGVCPGFWGGGGGVPPPPPPPRGKNPARPKKKNFLFFCAPETGEQAAATGLDAVGCGRRAERLCFQAWGRSKMSTLPVWISGGSKGAKTENPIRDALLTMDRRGRKPKRFL